MAPAKQMGYDLNFGKVLTASLTAPIFNIMKLHNKTMNQDSHMETWLLFLDFQRSQLLPCKLSTRAARPEFTRH